MAAHWDRVPWHVWTRLPASEKAEVLATFQENNLREGITAQRVKAKADKEGGSGRIGVEEWL